MRKFILYNPRQCDWITQALTPVRSPAHPEILCICTPDKDAHKDYSHIQFNTSCFYRSYGNILCCHPAQYHRKMSQQSNLFEFMVINC